MNTTIEAFKQGIRNAGIEPPADIVANGNLHRFTVSGDKPHANSGWYVFYADDPPAGAFGCWKRGISETWCSREYKSLTVEEKARYTANMEAAKAAREEELQRVQAECRQKSAELWGKGCDVKAKHPYLVAKKVKPYGLKQILGLIMVPVRDSGGILHGMQFIGQDGAKRFKTGTAVAGCFHAIGKPNGKILIAEGYATGATLHEITGHAVACAFNANNLRPVAEALRAKYPNIELIVCADDDHSSEGNTGLTKATEAALSANGILAIPMFPDTRGPKDTDFNDLARLSGMKAVRACIEVAAIPAPSPAAENQSQPEIESTVTLSWPEPVLFGEINTPDIPCTYLPSWLGEYAAAVATNTQTPPGMAVMMGLATVAACVQKRFQVARTPEHIEPLSIWTVTALPPASRKTAVVNRFTAPLTTWEQERAEALKVERARVASKREALESRIKTLQVQAGKAKNAADRESLISEICKLKEELPEIPPLPRIFTGDVTPERLQSLMVEQGERMAVLSDEGGIYAVMAGLYNNGKANIDVFLKGHAGSTVRVDRQERTAYLDEPALTFGLCVQPDIIRKLSETSFRGNGCLARFLYCLPTSNIGTRSARTLPIPESVKTAFLTGIYSLLNIPPTPDEKGRELARTLTLDPGANNAWEAFFDFIENNMGEGGELQPIQDWAGKLAGAALRIAGIMAVVEHGEAASVISEATMTKALDLSELLITHAQAAFELIDGNAAQHDAKEIFKWILAKGKTSFVQADIYRELRRFNDAKRLNEALKVLTTRHIISEPKKQSTGGRPSISIDVNPAVFQKTKA